MSSANRLVLSVLQKFLTWWTPFRVATCCC
jgi:hypothetical protein